MKSLMSIKLSGWTKVDTTSESAAIGGLLHWIRSARAINKRRSYINATQELKSSMDVPARVGLGEGDWAGEVVTCPWHGAQFNVQTGDVLAPPAPTGVRSFPVQVQGDDVLVELD